MINLKSWHLIAPKNPFIFSLKVNLWPWNFACCVPFKKVKQEITSTSYHSVWKSQKKSHSTLWAKRATFTFWVDKNELKKNDMRHLGDFSTTVFLHCFASYLQSWIQEVVRGKTCTSASFFKLTHFHRWIYVRNVGYIAWKASRERIRLSGFLMHFRHNHWIF